MQPSSDERQDLATLLGIARSVSSTLDLTALLQLILDHLKVVADYSGSSISVVEGKVFRILESRGGSAAEREEELIGLGMPMSRGGLLWEKISRGECVIIDNVRGEGPLAESYRTLVGDHIDSDGVSYIRSFLGVPLILRDRVIGFLTLSKAEPGYFTERHTRIATAIAVHAAAAIENARLYDEARTAQAAAARQLERFGVLTGITQQLLAATELDSLLAIVVESAVRLSGTAGAAVGLIEEDGRRIRFSAAAGEPADYITRFGPADIDDAFLERTAVGLTLTRRVPMAIEDYSSWGPSDVRHQLHSAAIDLQLRGVIVAPLLVDGAPIGVLRVHDTVPRAFTAEDVAVIQALADQAALAIEHTRLLQRGREAAVLEERARLARDLHDSVTQSVFSLGMLARAARTQHERGSERLGPTLGRIGDLAEEALVEMRSLLFELHPASLTEKGLPRALEQLVSSVQTRGNLSVTYAATTEARHRPEVELAMFRIAQEALTNAGKHARAKRVTVSLAEGDRRLVLTVTDDGRGFDPSAPSREPRDRATSSGLGLRSMRERAAATGVTLELESAPGAGTTIRVSAPLQDAPVAAATSAEQR